MVQDESDDGNEGVFEKMEAADRSEHQAIIEQAWAASKADPVKICITSLDFDDQVLGCADAATPVSVELGPASKALDDSNLFVSPLIRRTLINRAKGFGYMSTQEIPAGTLILREMGFGSPEENDCAPAVLILESGGKHDHLCELPAPEDQPDSFSCLPGVPLARWNRARRQVGANIFSTGEGTRFLFRAMTGFNHCCKPDAAWYIDTTTCTVGVFAMRRIPAETEVQVTYSPFEGHGSDAHFACACGLSKKNQARQLSDLAARYAHARKDEPTPVAK